MCIRAFVCLEITHVECSCQVACVVLRSIFKMQPQPWTSEVITIWAPGCSHIAFCMVADPMHVYSAPQYALIDLCATWHVGSQLAH